MIGMRTETSEARSTVYICVCVFILCMVQGSHESAVWAGQPYSPG